ncbi:MAG: hypothetical protein ABSG54_11255 [Terriglobia bacterium]|jgi:uncharacterized iron-regulated membrane protein
MHEVKPPAENRARGYETRDVTLRPAVWAAMGLALLILAGMLASWLAFKYFVRVQKLGPPASPFENTRELPPAPRLQVTPAEALKAYQAEENTKLTSYGWVEKNAGVVRIPIERAMELSLERGFPVRVTPSAPAGTAKLEATNTKTASAEARPEQKQGTQN